MNQHIFHKPKVWLLLILFCCANVPVSIIHLFEDHKDTIDEIDFNAAAPALSSIHTHCGFLQWTLSSFHIAKETFNFQFIQHLSFCLVTPETFLKGTDHNYFYLRGPPLVA